MPETLLFLETLLLSTSLYAYLHKKTRISLKYIFIDNIAVIIPVVLLSFLLNILKLNPIIISVFIIPLLILSIAFSYTMIRFWRTPKRKINASKNEIVSPADGNVIYIKRIETGEIPISIKGKTLSKLEELVKTELLNGPCWLVGINMTPFDVHKNCSPIDGKVILNQHFNGKFLSLKDNEALVENERNTYVIQGETFKIGVVQIASKLVRRIDSYVLEGNLVKRGDWLGMIRFGSQVDIIIPKECEVLVVLGQQIYAGKTIVAKV